MTPVLFMGSKAAGLALCRLMCETLPAGSMCGIVCPDDTGDLRSELGKFRTIADEYQLPLRVVSNRKETMAALDEFKPRYVIVHGWYQIIPVDEVPQREFFGFHYSPLPRYRGNAPLVWQIINGEKEIGISFFRFTSGMDEGPIAAQAFFPLGVQDTIADALAAAETAMLGIAQRLLPLLVSGEMDVRPQEASGASYCGLRLSDDGLIDWRRPARAVHDFVRAQSAPYPGAFTYLPDGRVLRVWRTELEPRVYYGVPGGVLEICDDWVLVACGEGALRLLSVDLDVDVEAGQRPRDYLRSLRTRLGR